MKKFYFIIPVVALGIFVYFYLNAKNGIEQKEKDRQAQQQKDQEERQRKEEVARKKAWEEANAQAVERIKEYNERQAKQKQQDEERQAATDQRDMAFREKDNLFKQTLNLKESMQTIKDQKDKVEEQLKLQRTQVDFLKAATRDVAQTRAVYESALQKLDNAVKAYAAAQQQAALAARNAATQKSN